MRTGFSKFIFFTAFCLALTSIQLAAQQSSPTHASPTQDQAQQPAENPPHVDQQTNPDDRKMESAIRSEFKKDPHAAYSNVRVHVTDNDVMLTGTVMTQTAKDQAAQVASEHAGGRSITNHIKVNKVNPKTAPGPGI
jgi:osmotically-inducible protein OsmY